MHDHWQHYLFPLILIAFLSLVTMWFNALPIFKVNTSTHNHQPLSTMYYARIRSFTLNGSLKNKIVAQKISQQKGYYLLDNVYIHNYSANGQNQQLSAKQAIYRSDDKSVQFTGNQYNGRVEIIINGQ